MWIAPPRNLPGKAFRWLPTSAIVNDGPRPLVTIGNVCAPTSTQWGDVLSIAQYHKHGGRSVVRSSRRRNRWLPRAEGECARVTAHVMFQRCHSLSRFVVSREHSIYQCL